MMPRQVEPFDLDSGATRVVRTDEGLVVDVDPVAHRKRMAGAAVVLLVMAGAFVVFGEGWLRWAAPTLLGVLAAFALLGKPPTTRLVATPARLEVGDAKGMRTAIAAEVRGVRIEHRVEIRGSGKNRRKVDVWPVLLQRADGDPWPLGKGLKVAKARRFAEDVAIATGFPFIDATDGTERVVAADHVNVPLLERLRGGLVAVRDPGPPPRGVRVEDAPDGFTVSAARFAWAAALPAVGVAAFLGFVAWVLAGAGVPGWIPLLLGAGAAALALVAADLVASRDVVRVDAEGLARGRGRLGAVRTRRVPLDAFEDVGCTKGVQLVGDAETRSLGFEHRDAATRAWVADAIVHALARFTR